MDALDVRHNSSSLSAYCPAIRQNGKFDGAALYPLTTTVVVTGARTEGRGGRRWPGKNIPFYQSGLDITAIDLTPAMLERARRRAVSLDVKVNLQVGDVQALDFPDDTFDTAVATFVFCSVPNPILGLTELCRVVKPGGIVLLLEHERSANLLLGAIMDLLNPLVVRLMGANINRRTVDNVKKSFLQIERVEAVGSGGIVKLIKARAG